MKVLLLVFALVFVAYAQQDQFIQTQFDAFKLKFGKSYKSVDEQTMRFKIFKSNLKRIARLNMNSLGQNNYGVNEFADLTPSEFSHMYLMPKRPTPEIKPEQVLVHNKSDVKLPSSWDWRKDGLINGKSCITPVYNQG
jgi:cathepsin F